MMRMHLGSAPLALVVFLGLAWVVTASAEDLSITAISGTEQDDVISVDQSDAARALLDTNDEHEVTTRALGVDALAGDDQVTSNAPIEAESRIWSDITQKNLNTEASAESVGILGGAGEDTLENRSALGAYSGSQLDIGDWVYQIDLGLTSWPSEAEAEAGGIEGGLDADAINNTATGVITAEALSFSRLVKISLDAIEIPIDVLGKAETTTRAISTATGMRTDPLCLSNCLDPGARETLDNAGLIDVDSAATAITAQGSFELLGAAKVAAATEGHAFATGLAGGYRDDVVKNMGRIHVDAISSADFTSAELKMKGLMIKGAFTLFGLDTGDIATRAISEAIGIDGGDGDDILTHGSLRSIALPQLESLDVFSSAYANSLSVTVSVSPPLVADSVASGPLVADASSQGAVPSTAGTTPYSAIYGDASTTAVAVATGLAGADGSDTLESRANLKARAEAEATSDAIMADVGFDKKSFIPVPGAAVVDSSTGAWADAVGLDGGKGFDVLTNSGALDASSLARGRSLSVGVTIKGVAEGFALGVAVTDSSSRADASAIGISAGTGGAEISNSGSIDAVSTADDDSSSISAQIGVVGGKNVGVAAGVTLARASATSLAESYGIDAEGGPDSVGDSGEVTVDNLGTIHSEAISTAQDVSVAVSFNVALQGVTAGGAAVMGDGTAIASATGIRTGSGEDEIDNDGP